MPVLVTTAAVNHPHIFMGDIARAGGFVPVVCAQSCRCVSGCNCQGLIHGGNDWCWWSRFAGWLDHFFVVLTTLFVLVIVDVLSGDSCGSEFYVRNSVILHTIGKISVRGVEWYQIWVKKPFLSRVMAVQSRRFRAFRKCARTSCSRNF